jgi:nitrilase
VDFSKYQQWNFIEPKIKGVKKMNFPKFKAASVIASPYLFDVDSTVDKCCSFIDEATKNNAKIIVFPETFIPMYPWWVWMGINNVKRLELFKKLFVNSVEMNDSRIQKICEKAKENEIFVVIGINERDGMTLYNSQVFINEFGEVIGKRRKLVPTGEERTVWGRGDGSDLIVYDTNLGKIGGLICYENSMTLSRYALYTMGEQIHIANWPGSNFKSQPRDRTKTIETVSKFIAFEGQMFVIASSSCIGEEELEFYHEIDPSTKESLDVGGGIAGIVSPLGEFVSAPIKDQEGIAYGEIDLELILDSKHLIDNVGHYARWDVTKLLLNNQMNVQIVNNDNHY